MLHIKTEDNIVIATLDNSKYNTLTWEMLTDLKKLIVDVEQDESLKGIILTGSGHYFCSGFNIPMLLKLTTRNCVIDFLAHADGTLVDLFSCQKPVIACLNGSAIAAGLIMAMCCDYRVGINDPRSKYGLSEIKLGLSLSLVHTEILRFGLHINDLRNLACFGNLLDYKQARAVNIIDETAENPVARAKEIINDWMGNPGHPFIHIKESIRYTVVKKIHKRLEEEQGKENLNVIHNPETRRALEEIAKKMG